MSQPDEPKGEEPPTEQKLRAYLERATTALRQTKQRLDRVEAKQREPIAIIGMACRFPGGVHTPEQLWQLLDEGRDAIAPFPRDRGWPVDLHDPDPDHVGTTYTQAGGFLDHPGLFDAAFFGISPREAAAVDPQQRLLLELSWEALEHAGIVPESLYESDTGVYVGICYDDYVSVAPAPEVAEDGYATLGNLYSVCSGRIAYTLGLRGPAVTVDTACSTSLVTLHLACQALRSGECELALAGGATTFSTPEPLLSFARLRTLSPDGRCKSFSAEADGAGWAEGAGVLVLERLSDALRHGHRVLAVVRGSAVNQDGRSQGLTAPNGPAQQRVIQTALAHAGLSAADIDVVEAHGTGTQLGDPIEAHAIKATYGREHDRARPLVLGSIKSNLGHTQAAAGIAGVMKVILAMQHERVPRTLHAERPSPLIDWSDGSVELAREPKAWPRGQHARRAGVSSFGISGTNAHVIIEEAPAIEEQLAVTETAHASELAERLHPLVLSGKTPAALRDQAHRMAEWLACHDHTTLVDVGYSLATSRSHFTHRAAVIASTHARARAGLEAFAQAGTPVEVVVGAAQAAPRLAMLFTGQGSQRAGMGRELYGQYPVFRATFEQICARFDALLESSLRDIVFAEPESQAAARLDQTRYTQPALFALEVSLFRLFESWGVRPALLLGHSIGELVAAHVAGVLSLDDACKLVSARARLMQALPEGGAMVSIQASEQQVREALGSHAGRVDIAGLNGPLSTVISGDEEPTLAIARRFEERGHKTQRLAVSHAFHSPRIEPMLAEFRKLASSLTYAPPKIPIVSNVTGALADATELMSPEYWVSHVRGAVRFLDGVHTLEQAEASVFLELGPHGVLCGLASGCLTAAGSDGIPLIPSLRRGAQEVQAILTALAHLHGVGVGVDWPAVFGPTRPQLVPLPTYPFQRSKHWLESRSRSSDRVGEGLGGSDHPMLGASMTPAGADTYLITSYISVETHPWLADHVVFGRMVVPGAALLELANAAAHHVGLGGVDELTLEVPLVLDERHAAELQLQVGEPDDVGHRTITIHARVDQHTWVRHAQGVLGHVNDPNDVIPGDVSEDSWPPAGAVAMDLDDVYDRLAARGLEYGPAFRGLWAAWRRDRQWFVEVRLPSAAGDAEAFGLHPALLDAAYQVLALDAALPSGTALLPLSYAGMRLEATGATVMRGRLIESEDGRTISVVLTDGDQRRLASIARLTLRSVTVADARSPATRDSKHIYHQAWAELDAGRANVGERSDWVSIGPGEIISIGGSIPHVDLDAVLTEPRAPSCIFASFIDTDGDALRHALDGLRLLQRWRSEPRLHDSKLVLLTRGAVAAGELDDVTNLDAAPLWGLVRSAQIELADARLTIVDLDVGTIPPGLASAIEDDHTQLASRRGVLVAPHLVRAGGSALAPPEVGAWHLAIETKGTLDGVVLAARNEATAPLEADQVRLAVRSAGLNFRDVLNVLGMYPGEAGLLGLEGAGVVIERGSGVTELELGARVMGMFPAAFGSLAVADQRKLARIPAGWSFAAAAAVPAVFLTAYYALVELAALRPGERILIHAAAGGVGMAATQLARHLGAEVLATASPPKWDTLRALGFDDAHLSSSRTLEFEPAFMRETQGRGVDVVLNSLAGEFVDASLRLLPRGGRFIEMGKTDLREPGVVAATHDAVTYRAFDLTQIEPSRIQVMLAALVDLFEQRALTPLPVARWDVRDAPDALRFVSQAKHIGKVVLDVARTIEPDGTVLITGGTGALGTLIAKHLVEVHGVRRLLLCSRRGDASPGADELRRSLAAAGAHVDIVAADIADRDALAGLLARIPHEHPLTAIIHTAGVLVDGTLASLDADKFERVFWPKVRAAHNLHELTKHQDLAAFVLFSSVVATLGNPGQANYAAANAWLDGLARHRHTLGLPATSIGWGPWSEGGMATRLSSVQRERLRKRGLVPLTPEQGLAVFDAALAHPTPVLIGAHIDLRALEDAHALPPMLRRLALHRVLPRANHGIAVASSIQPVIARGPALVELIQAEASVVLGAQAGSIDQQRPLQELGLDSLMAVELRGRLQKTTGLRLPATLLFDYPTVAELARFIDVQLAASIPTPHASREVAAEPHASPRDTDDPIAIVGIACRLPGHVDTPEQLWRLLVEESDAITPFPSDRGWHAEERVNLHLDEDRPGTIAASGGGFIDGHDRFDPAFFGISPREAVMMDPQQRLLLELSWEALERAGIAPPSLRETNTGVFVGVCYDDYLRLAPAPEHAEDGYAALGNLDSVASGRISYTLGLHGPAITIDTACSSSLVTLHLACQALRNRECDLVLSGGATVFATLDPYLTFSRLKTLSPDGRCKAFSAQADGAGWSEGAGMLVLERLSDALANGHRVMALVRGSAINQDGRSQGLTAPNGPSQQRVIRAALAAARLDAAQVDMVEAHGTGTPLGDPIEAQALQATYGRAHSLDAPLWLGSIKSNIGHSQAAAGVTGVIKAVLAMQHALLPRTLHADDPSPHVDWTTGGVQLLLRARAWPTTGQPRRAAVSSFGISGTNAHVILEQAPELVPTSSMPSVDALPLPLIVSGNSDGAVRAQAARLRDALDGKLADIADSLVTSRPQLERRAAVVAGSIEDARARLDELANGQVLIVATASNVELALLFTGQGAQRLAMGRELHAAFPVFRDAFEDACARLDPLLPKPLRDVVFADDGDEIDQTQFTQAALFALEVSLFRLVASWGIFPAVMLGHSIGELAAAHLAGVFSLDDACKLVAARGRLMQALPSGGAMLSIQASELEVAPELAQHTGVDIAGINGPMSTVVSGDEAAVLALGAVFEARGRKARRLTVSHAFHSHRMDAMLDDFARVAASITYHPPSIPIISNVSGKLATTDELCDPTYWVRHVRAPVRFLDGVQALEAFGANVMLELGPHGVLCSMAAACLSSSSTPLIPAMRRDASESETLAAAVGALHCHGVRVDWSAYFAPYAPRRVQLPTYAFQRQRYWLDAPARLGLTDSWTYQIRWLGIPERRSSASGTWLVTTCTSLASSELVSAILDALTIAGVDARLVTVPPDCTRELLASAIETALGHTAPALVLSAFALDEAPHPHHPALPTGLALNLALAQTLTASAPLWLLTQSAVSVDDSDPLTHPLQSTTWGFARAFSLEHPERWGGVLDLPLTVDAASLSRLPAALVRDDFEDQLALRPAGLFARRLVHAPLQPRTSFRPRGTALITGGTGALGAHVARWLVRSGIEQLVLTSRRGLDAPGAPALVAELEQLGPRVLVVACDVSSHHEVSELLARLRAGALPLRSIIHTAGILDDGVTTALTPARFERVFSPKASAAQHLHELSRSFELDHFVLFSSVAGTLGNAGQSNYAAANAYLEALAEHRRQQGLPATAIAWGPWAADGMAASAVVDQRTRRQGLRALAPEPAIAALERALVLDDAVLAVADVDWPAFDRSYTAARPRPLLAEIQATTTSRPAELDAPSTATVLDELRTLLAPDRDRRLLELVLRHTAKILGVANTSSIDPRRGFSDLGLDSLMAVELRQHLQRETGLALPATLTFDFPSPARVRDMLIERAFAQPDDDPAADASDDELRALLARVPIDGLRRSGLLAALLQLDGAREAREPTSTDDLDALESDDLVDAIGLLLGDE